MEKALKTAITVDHNDKHDTATVSSSTASNHVLRGWNLAIVDINKL